MSKVFFIGCTHFGHKNIIRLAKRPFDTVHEMDETIMENWNKTVKRGDTIWHLGDFGYHDNNAILKKLNGNIQFIRGNHDPANWGVGLHEIKIADRWIVLCHYPIEEWNRWFRGSIHIHAHTHKPDLISAERRFNVSVEAINYTPISLDEIWETAKQWD